MTNKERIEALEREVAELKERERNAFYPYWSVIPPTVAYGKCANCGGSLVYGHVCPWRYSTTSTGTGGTFS